MQSQLETVLAILLIITISIILKSSESSLSVSLVFQTGSVALYIFLKIFKNWGEYLPLLIISGCSAGTIFYNGARLFCDTLKTNKN